MSQISLQNISTVLESTTNRFRLPPLSAEFAVGEFVAIVGPSGVGKSTLLRLIAGLETLTQGAILFDSQRVDHLASQQRNVGMVFQNYALFPHLSVADNLGYALYAEKVQRSKIKHAVEQVAERLAIEDLLARFPRQLSGGQRQRVAIGRAMLSSPQVFLFDEPFSNLDPTLRVQMRHQLKELHENLATTTLFVTHDQHEAMALAQRIMLLSQRGIEQFDTPENLYRYPKNLYVARFFGEPKINVFDGLADGQGVRLINQVEYQLRCKLPEALHHKTLIVGIRPRAFCVSLDFIAHGLSMQVSRVEYLGDTQYLYLAPYDAPQSINSSTHYSDVTQSVVVVDNRSISIGQRVYLTFALEDILLFDENQERISL
ncbi:ABC transporter ATP-binding protein [Paraglaciecola chathamensis]|uniref:ABC transporter ATP-binding protein n=1 Tax=Paraglaciecola chathamensis TaxID=368405 RepID=UPI0027031A72|nr:ABC transporter ATP-binding protein [Paraglaciecola chathamensis]